MDFAYKVTNKHTPEKTTFEGEKDWKDDRYYKDGKPVEGYSRPPVTINLLADGAATGKSITLDGTADANGEYEAWKYRFKDLDKFKGGKEIKYSVTETGADGYTPSYDGGKVENTPKEGEELNPVTVKVKKVDALTKTGAGLAGATFTLTPPADPKSTEASETFATDKNGEAEITFTKDGIYTLEETAAPDGYEKPSTTTYTITVTKEFVRVELKQSVWTWIYNLIAGIGNEANYVADEDGLGGTLTVADPPTTTEVRATKAWQDDDDRDGIRCDVTLDLYESVGGAEAARVEGQSKTIAKGATGDQLTVAWADLPIRRDGKAIVYSVNEVKNGTVTGTDGAGTYAYEVTGDMSKGFTVTNTHTPELVDVPVRKVWDDANNQDGCRPGSVDVTLSGKDAGGADAVLPEGTVATQTLAEGNGWAYTWTDLYKYQNHGKIIAYTVTEARPTRSLAPTAGTYAQAVEGDMSKGFTVTNRHTPEKVEVKVSKAWDDADDQDGCRPEGVEVELLADGEPTGDRLTLDEGNGWAGAFTGLDKYKAGEVGKLVGYAVREVETETVTGEDAPRTYAWEVAPATDEAGEAVEYAFAITNTHTPETVDVPVTKTWDDGDDANGVRPASIVVRLLADGVEVDSATIEPDEGGAWAHTFTGLPKYRDHGTEIAYTVEEDPVPGYEAAYDGTDITNTHEVERVTVNPPIKKAVEGDGAPADAKFTFTMAAQPARSQLPEGMDEMPMPEGSDGQVKTVTVKGPGEYEFGEFAIERPGTYVYTMAEVDTGENGWTYDGATYTVTYVVEARDGHLSATTKIERDGKAYSSDTPEFVNSYEGGRHKRRVPKTGDPTSPLLPWLTVAGSAALACGLTLSRRRRRR